MHRPGIQPKRNEETSTQTCTQTFVAAFLTVAQTRTDPKVSYLRSINRLCIFFQENILLGSEKERSILKIIDDSQEHHTK